MSGVSPSVISEEALIAAVARLVKSDIFVWKANFLPLLPYHEVICSEERHFLHFIQVMVAEEVGDLWYLVV